MSQIKGSSIVSAVHHLKMASDHLEDFKREHPGTKGARLFTEYDGRIQWMFKNLLTHPFLPEEVRAGIRRELESDVFAVEALHEKIPLLKPAQREFIEMLVDAMLRGEEIQMA